MTHPVAFLFPGQLSEWVGMGRDFYAADPHARELFERTSRRTSRDLPRILFEGPEEDLHESLAAQAGVYLVSTLAARALEREGVSPRASAGYSLGNYAAMVAAGAVSYDDALEVLVAVWEETEKRGIRGTMGAVIGARREAVEETCERLRESSLGVWIGNVNASTQFVLTGDEAGVSAALEELRPRALSVLPLSMRWPIHSERMRPVADAIAPLVASLPSLRAPVVPYYGPEGTRVESAAEIRRLLGEAFCFPTLWRDAFESMVAAGHRLFLEAGPGEMLSRMARWIDRNARCHPAGRLDEIVAAAGIVRAP
jgi:[acyl-carrier-protein] S-malonyltransferase